MELSAADNVKSPGELYEHLSRLGELDAYNLESCTRLAEMIREILRLKKERHAVILAHNYQRPEIFEVADFIGDSLELAKQATRVEVDIIVFCGVHFMAETAKILNPGKTVLLPDLRAGCSLADSVTADALLDRKEELKGLYPDLSVVSYVNTTADVKAESDVCCTSSNARKIVQKLASRHILFVPDKNLAHYVQQDTDKMIIAWDGNCYVHHQITAEQIFNVRRNLPNAKIVVHPECRADILELADAVLSTSGMVAYAKESDSTEFLIVTECGLSDRLLLEVPEKKFYKACKLCQYMKMITLEDTLESLRSMQHEITLSEDIRRRAEKSLLKMFELGA